MCETLVIKFDLSEYDNCDELVDISDLLFDYENPKNYDIPITLKNKISDKSLDNVNDSFNSIIDKTNITNLNYKKYLAVIVLFAITKYKTYEKEKINDYLLNNDFKEFNTCFLQFSNFLVQNKIIIKNELLRIA